MKKILAFAACLVVVLTIVVAKSDPNPPPEIMASFDKDVVNTYFDPNPPPEKMF